MDEEVRVTVEAPDSVINPDSMSHNDSMQPKQTADDMAGNQSEAIETDNFILMGKRVENDLNGYEDDGKSDQRDEIDDDDDDEIYDDDDQLRDKFILEESEDPAHNFPNTKTGYTSNTISLVHFFTCVKVYIFNDFLEIRKYL